MTTTALSPAPPEMEFAVRWTRADCDRLEAAGFLNYRYELMNGVIIRKMGQHLPHALTVSRAFAWMQGHFGVYCAVSQTSITVAPDETALVRPEPDVTLLNKPGTQITTKEPYPEDILLLIEVSDTTLDYDLVTKSGVYARAGVSQYLVIDINGRVVYDHRLTASGEYQRDTRVPGDSVTLVAAPNLTLTVDDLLLPQP
ncbi:MAG: Uma2 family endonuclease [Akkermansiaceae bacterium]|nr:Uma2 family endonuclease [Armatimonadota bacterium]